MRRISTVGQVSILLAVLLLVVACASDDAEQDVRQIDEARAQLLYRSALTAVLERDKETGEYIYLDEDIKVLEQVLEIDPKHPTAMEVLAWIYSTYPAYVRDQSVNERALDYGLEAFKASGNRDVFMYEILGAAMYKNGHLILGDQFFDGAIQKADSAEQTEYFRESKKTVRGLYADSN